MSPSASLAALDDAVRYLRACGIRLPKFGRKPGTAMVGGSAVEYAPLRLTMGNYPTAFTRNWFAMHELGHLLCAEHRPLRRKRFRLLFGEPFPPDYDAIHKRDSWKTAATHQLSWLPGRHRPKGQPSHYGRNAGGEERFCELIALMYANGDFSMAPPPDLEELWAVCWNDGLARMT
jgi:hypothetical protein